ncbi:MAG: hypothetical protein D4S02_03200 [Rhodocyclaceae bacterium]|nr:MAG: hypothetical protein D4S02_03200 [Rhodocyclaceae bacterium]
MNRHTTLLSLLLMTALVPPADAAKSYCCSDERGRQVCGDSLPRECFGRSYREVSERGTTLRQVEAPLTAEQQARRDAELAAKKKEERAAMEEKRKNQALLNTYASEKDVDLARTRALADVENRTKEVQSKYNEALKRKQKLEGEREFYQKKPMPPELTEQIKASEAEIKAQQNAIEAKKQEMEQVRIRFDEEKKRYLDLIRGGKDAAGSGK